VIANSAFLAAMVLLLTVFAVLGQLEFLAPYKSLIVSQYSWHVLASLLVVFLNLFGCFYLAGKALFLRRRAASWRTSRSCCRRRTPWCRTCPSASAGMSRTAGVLGG
jgi:hypothetical protein